MRILSAIRLQFSSQPPDLGRVGETKALSLKNLSTICLQFPRQVSTVCLRLLCARMSMREETGHRRDMLVYILSTINFLKFWVVYNSSTIIVNRTLNVERKKKRKEHGSGVNACLSQSCLQFHDNTGAHIRHGRSYHVFYTAESSMETFCRMRSIHPN